jgi:hypothetical protein
MNLVAQPAGPPSRELVDVNKMKITIAIPESGQRCRSLFGHKRGLMATKAKLVCRFIKGSIHSLRIFVRQQPKIVGTVRLVASGAFLALNGAMVPRIRSQQLPYWLKLLLADLDWFIVAFQTGVLLFGNEQMIRL